jgi:hypothetical protein
MGSDEMNRKGARRFAWRITEPTDELEDTEEAPQPPAPPVTPAKKAPRISTEKAREQLREALEKQCAVLADEVTRVWEIDDPVDQRAALTELLQSASALGIAPAALDAFPVACLRLIRLMLRFFLGLPEESRAQVMSVLLWLPVLEIDETGDLLVQVARGGMRELSAGAWLEMRKAQLSFEHILPVHVEQLAKVVDAGPSWKHRLTALDLLAAMHRVPRGPAVASLRRALRLPHLEVRQLALTILLACSPPRLLAEDVLFLLQDAMDQPLDTVFKRPLRDIAERYSWRLHDAVAQIAPEGGAALLVDLIDAGRPWGFRERAGGHPFGVLQPGWALDALAAGYAEQALQTIDPLLQSSATDARLAALKSLRHLPPALAEPRLKRAAADTAPSVARVAGALWLERMGTPCPVEIVATLPLDLLDHPPDEVLLTRAQLLHGRSNKAAAAMVEVLFDEAPRREALVLLVAMLSDAPFWELGLREALPKGVGEATERLVARFGAGGIEGLCWLARRYPGGGFASSWLYRLADLAKKEAIPAGAHPALRALAEDHLRRGDDDELTSALRLLLRSGVSPALHPRVLQVAITPSDDDFCQSTAAELLLSCKDPALDAQLVAQMERAVATRAVETFEALAYPIFDQGLPGALSLAERVIAALDAGTPLGIARRCAAALSTHARLPEGWLREALAQPDEPRFLVALWLVKDDAAEPVREALRAALRSPSELVVEETLSTLLIHRLLDGRDPLVPEALARLSLVRRARSSGGLLFARNLPDAVLAVVAEAFTLPPCAELDDLCERLFLWKTRPAKAALNKVLSRVVDDDARAAIADHLGDLVQEEHYWQYDDDAEDDEGDESEAPS